MHKLITTAALALSLPVASYAGKPSADEECKALSDAVVQYMKGNKIVDYSVVTADAFYSEKLGACFYTEIADSGGMYKIRDLSKTIIKDGPDYFNTLFYCDREGANSAKLDVLKKYQGNVYKYSYRDWQDDGFGGLPATIKPPEKPYTDDMCKKLYLDWMKKIK